MNCRIIDIHTHIYPVALARRAMEVTRHENDDFKKLPIRENLLAARLQQPGKMPRVFNGPACPLDRQQHTGDRAALPDVIVPDVNGGVYVTVYLPLCRAVTLPEVAQVNEWIRRAIRRQRAVIHAIPQRLQVKP